MYDGWLSFAGVEIVNANRMQAYRNSLMPTLWMGGCSTCDSLQESIEDTTVYTTPEADEAPWFDVDTPGSGEFIGFMVTSRSGFLDSTREATVTESTLEGGTVGRTRRGSREIRVAGMLIGASQIGAEAGLTWLKNVLDGSLCNQCDDSDDLCFLVACPRPGENPDDFIRHLRRVKCVSGPTILGERPLSGCPGYMIEVEFQFVAGSPYVYGEPIPVAAATGTELLPVLPGSEVFPLTIPIETCWAYLDKPSVNVLRDPDCPPVPNAPTVPVLTSACKPLTFSTYSYYPTQTIVAVRINQYESRPVVARGAGVWLAVYAHDTVKNITTNTVIRAKTSTTSGASWGTEYTLYDEADSNRGLEPAGITYATDVNKFIFGVNNRNFSTGKYKGEILTSSTGLTGSWSVVGNLDSAMSKWGAYNYHLTDVEHFENGSTNGITYAAVSAWKTSTSKSIIILLRSFDLGVTWNILSQPWLQSDDNSYTYPQLAIWPNGEIAVLNNVAERHEIWFKRSSDGGKKWSGPHAIVATAASGIPAPVITNDGGIMVMYRDLRDPGPRGLGRHNYRYSKDHGRRWFPGSNLFTKNSDHGQMGADWAVGSTGDLGVVFCLDFTNTNGRVYWTTFYQKENYLSYAVGVPDSALKAWQAGVLLLQVRTGSKPTRQMRVRLIPRPIATQQPEDLDPCSVCGAFVIDYAPANTVIYFDGMSERVTMKVGSNIPLSADHLVSGEGGSVFQWPIFNCGIGYFLLIDVDVETIVDLAVAVANRE